MEKFYTALPLPPPQHYAQPPVDAYGVSQPPKKPSVPNWLREEIIKKKPVLASAAPELSKEEEISFEDEGVDDVSESESSTSFSPRGYDADCASSSTTSSPVSYSHLNRNCSFPLPMQHPMILPAISGKDVIWAEKPEKRDVDLCGEEGNPIGAIRSSVFSESLITDGCTGLSCIVGK